MMNRTSTIPTDPRTLSCPPWCSSDHAAEWAEAPDVDRRLKDFPAVCRHFIPGAYLTVDGELGDEVCARKFDDSPAVVSHGDQELTPAAARNLAGMLLKAAALCEMSA